jgi:hypothetical protein
MFTETSAVTRAIRCIAPGDIYHCYRHENIPEGNVFRPYILSLYGRLINIDYTVTQLWSPITLGKPEDGGGMFPETSVLTKLKLCYAPEDIYHCCHSDDIPDDSVLRPYTMQQDVH